jgi:hypothetical protein
MHWQTDMRQILILTFLIVCSWTFGQNRQETGVVIKNRIEDLKANKVTSIEQNVFSFADRKQRKLNTQSQSKTVEHYNQYGQLSEEIIFEVDTKTVKTRTKYYYIDTLSRCLLKYEMYDNKDSIIYKSEARLEDGKPICMLINDGVACFGNYKFTYDDRGLIAEAIWYGPKKGIWADKKMIQYNLTKLTYSFR